MTDSAANEAANKAVVLKVLTELFANPPDVYRAQPGLSTGSVLPARARGRRGRVQVSALGAKVRRALR
jgi:hypothetical protein